MSLPPLLVFPDLTLKAWAQLPKKQHNDIQYKNVLNLTLSITTFRIIALDTVMLSVENIPIKLSEIM